MEDFFQIGIFTNTHGIRGEIKVFPTTDDPKRFKRLKKVILRTPKEEKELEKIRKDLEKANEALEAYKTGDWENKYNTLKGEYDTYKTDTETKAVKSAKEAAYKQLLIDAGISDKRVASIMKVSGATLDEIKLDKDGKIEDADKLTESAKTEWADFIVTPEARGAGVATPPANDGDGGKQQSRAAQLVAQYRNEHYGSPKEE